MLIYQLVQQAGNMGVWTKDLKLRSNLQQPAIAKCLKALEARKLVKAVKSVASRRGYARYLRLSAALTFSRPAAAAKCTCSSSWSPTAR